jgi:hypothetical protein
MVSVPRELADRIQLRLDHAASAFKAAKPERDQFRAILEKPGPQPHREPTAWMVGTAIWWTEEEAERDAAATGLPIVGLGPLYSGQVQGEPVAWRYRHAKPGMSWFFTESPDASGCLVDGFEYEVSPLYVRADPGEVERLREGIAKHWKVVCDQRAEIESLRDQLTKVVRSGALTAPEHEALEAECCALSASAEPSAPGARDELVAELAGLEINGDRPCADIPDDHDEFLDANASAALWLLQNVERIRAALESKPS